MSTMQKITKRSIKKLYNLLERFDCIFIRAENLHRTAWFSLQFFICDMPVFSVDDLILAS